MSSDTTEQKQFIRIKLEVTVWAERVYVAVLTCYASTFFEKKHFIRARISVNMM